MRCDTKHPIALLIDILICLTAVSLLTVVELGSFQPYKTIGFYCQDPKIAFKRDGEAITTKLLLSVSFIVPYFIFLIVEKYLHQTNNDKLWIRRAHFSYFKYLHGLCLTFLLTEIAKLMVGEPRPHFLDTCRPYEAFNCTVGQYFSKYSCSNKIDTKYLIDSYKSFPSGHASFSNYSAIFFIFYFARNIQTRSHFLVKFLQVICVSWAMLSSFSRITDHRHHWWDVLCGSILGAAIALYFVNDRITKKTKTVYDTEKIKHLNKQLMNSEK